MSLIRRRRWLAGFILGLGPASASSAQDGLPALPTSDPARQPPSPIAEPARYPLVRPRPAVVEVPPGGNLPAWRPLPIDPVAFEKVHPPKHVPAKSRSWGWRRLQGRIFGYPEEFEPRPLGASVYEAGKIMTANAAEAGLILHRFDFIDGSAELSQRGGDQLAKLAAQLAVSPFALIIERTPDDPSLAEARRYAVLARLARGPCPVPSERVVIGVPRAHGMSGPDAQVIAGNALGRTQQYGPPIPINASGVNSPSGVTSSGGGSGGINP